MTTPNIPDELFVSCIIRKRYPDSDVIDSVEPHKSDELRRVSYNPAGAIVNLPNVPLESQDSWEMTPYAATKDDVTIFDPDDLTHETTTTFDSVAGGNSLLFFKAQSPLQVGLIGFMYGTPGKWVTAKTFKKEGDSGWWFYYTMPNTDYKAWQFHYASAQIELQTKSEQLIKVTKVENAAPPLGRVKLTFERSPSQLEVGQMITISSYPNGTHNGVYEVKETETSITCEIDGMSWLSLESSIIASLPLTSAKSSIVCPVTAAGIVSDTEDEITILAGQGDDGTVISGTDFAFRCTGPCIDHSAYKPTGKFMIYASSSMMTDFFCMNGSFRSIRVYNPHNETKEFRVSMIDLGPDFLTPYFGPGDYTS